MLKIFKKYFTFNSANNYQPIQTKQFMVGIFLLIMIFNTSWQWLNCYLLKQNNLTANLNTLNIITEINKIRGAYGLAPLIENPKLDIAALLKAQDMINNDYFNHYSPTGKTPWDWINSAQYNYKYAGENLALNFFDDQTTVQAWLNSPTHKANILNPNYQDTGVAILSGVTPTTKESRTVVVQMFGAEKTTSTPVLKVSATEPIEPTTTTIKSTTTTLVTTTTLLATTTTKENTMMINSTISNDDKKTINQEDTALAFKNLAPVLNKQANRTNETLALNTRLINEAVNPKITKAINNSFGLGLLFLGIFGIININTQENISNQFKKKLLIRNAIVLVISLGFIVNNLTSIVYKVKIPTI